VRGDFLVSDRAALERLEQALVGCTPEHAGAVVRGISLPADLQDTLVSLLAEVADVEAPTPSGD